MTNPSVYRFLRQGVRRYIQAERRARSAERQLRRFEDHVTFKDIELDAGKTRLTREEPKDFSRIIAANINAETVRERTMRENGVRLVLGFAAVAMAYNYRTYWSSQEDEIQSHKRKLSEQAVSIESHMQALLEKDEKLKVREEKLREMFEEVTSTLFSISVAEIETQDANEVIEAMSMAEDIGTIHKLYGRYKDGLSGSKRMAEEKARQKIDDARQDLGSSF